MIKIYGMKTCPDCIAIDEQVKDKFPQNKLFLELVFWAFFTIILEVILAYLGVYKLFF